MESPDRFPWKDEVCDLTAFQQEAWTKRLIAGLNVNRPGEEKPDPDRQKLIARLLEENLKYPLERLRTLAARLRELFILKDELIEMVIVSAIAHQPMLLVGKPGTAKSKIVLRFCEGLGLGRVGGSKHQTVFQYLLHGFTEPDEVLGPVDIHKLRLEPPVFERFRKGSITDAEVIFMDEVFRANSAILNALLSVINERQVYEGGQAHEAKARLVYGASNETPTAKQMEDLRAFYERFIIRVESLPVPLEFNAELGGPTADRVQLLAQGWFNEVRELRAGYRPEGSALEQVACLNDILLLNRAVAELWGGQDLSGHEKFLGKYHKVVAAPAGGDSPLCEIDDRKFVRLLAVVRARSLFSHSGPPACSDLTVLRHIWDNLDGKQALQEKVASFIASECQ